MDNNMYRQNDPIKEYYNQTKKEDFKDFIKNAFILIIALVHRLFGYPYFNKMLEKFLISKNISEKTISIILLIYLAISVLFVIISIWKIIRNIKIINFIYILLVIIYIGYFGYGYIKTTSIYNQIVNKPLASFVIEAKELCNKSKIYWQKESITNGSKEETYIKSNGEYCNNKKFVIVDSDTDYSITIDVNGKITDFKITNGKFQFIYNGLDLTVDDIVSNKFVNVEENNKVVIPSCSLN